MIFNMFKLPDNTDLGRMTDFRSALLKPDCTLADALKNMNETGFRAALVVDEDERLMGLMTDFDIRQAMMNGSSLETPVSRIMNPRPKVGRVGMQPAEYRDLMVKHGNECLPVVDARGTVRDLVLLREFVERDSLANPIVIMAGGQGKRLWPLTQDTPKPLLPVADTPMLGHILNHVQSQGFKHLFVSTHYKSEQIEDFIAHHTPAGLDARIIKERDPLGTAGCLKSLESEDSREPIFIMNGDILTTLDFQTMLSWHRTHGNMLTLACRQYAVDIPYGILETDGQRLQSLQEKPRKIFNMNAGIYLVERAALRHIPPDTYCDMTDLINTLLAADLPVGTFPISEPWIDIGQHEDYARVNQDVHQYLSRSVAAASPDIASLPVPPRHALKKAAPANVILSKNTPGNRVIRP